MSIDQAIKKAIQDNLPAAVAVELSEYIAQAEILRKENERLHKGLLDQESEYAVLKKELILLHNREAFHGDLLKREKAVEKAELHLEVEMLKVRLEQAEKRADVCHELAKTVFQNRSMTRMTSTNVPVYEPYAHGGGHHTQKVQTTTETFHESEVTP